MPTHALHFTVDQFHLESQFGFTKSEVCIELSNLKDVRKTETKKQTNRNTVTKYIKHHYVAKLSELISLESYSFSIFRQFCSLLKNKEKKQSKYSALTMNNDGTTKKLLANVWHIACLKFEEIFVVPAIQNFKVSLFQFMKSQAFQTTFE